MEFYLIPSVNQDQLNDKMDKDEIVVIQEEAYLFVIYVITQDLVANYRQDMEEQMGYELEYLVQCKPVGFSVENSLLLLFKPDEPDLFVEESSLLKLLQARMFELSELPFGFDEEKLEGIADEDGYLIFHDEPESEEEEQSEEVMEISEEDPVKEEESESDSDDYWI